MRYSRAYLALVPAVACIGCETFTPPTQRLSIEKDKAILIDTVATRRGTYLFKRTSTGPDEPERWVIVAEPPPDVALASAVKAAVEASVKTPAGVDASGKASLDVAQTLTKLVERTEAITILRDSMFRLSEAYANGTMDKDAYGKKYDKVLDLVKEVVLSQAKAQQIQEKAIDAKNKVLIDPTLNGDQKLKALQSIQ